MIKAHSIELLAPAKDLTCGLEAVRHGADAVYIGAPRFSARAAAACSVDDIRALCDYAHLYDARVYVALNTILKDDELKSAELIIRQVYDAGADAVIIQDMGITRLDIPPVPLHASTQTDNCTVEKVRFLHETGFSRIVLARELTINEIQTISEAVPQARLEAFVHGSLCVSYSGRCYLSAALNGRSANRGECAQCCRLRYSLLDADGQKIGADKHYLSLKDMNCSDDLEAMMRAGVVSFKIEGRLKDMSYIKNITAYYRQRLDAIFAADPAYYRASTGRSAYTFSPQPAKSFNRGFTTCFLHGRDIEISSFDTPKSVGEAIGRVKEIKGNTFTVAGLKPVHNGDGLAFFNAHGELEGFRVNRAEANRIYPQQMTQQTQQKQQTSHLPQIPPKQFHLPQPKTLLFRNYDHEFETLLSRPSAERRIAVRMEWGDYPEGFALTATDETDARAIILRPFGKEIARKPQADNIRRQLSKSGDTPFEALEIIICGKDNYFVPSSLLSEMRREVLERLVTVRRIRYHRLYVKHSEYDRAVVYPTSKPDYTANVYNREAVEFYRRHGVEVVEPAFEEAPREDVAVMTARHCLKYSLGWCPVHHKTQSPCREPFYLSHGDNRLRLEFDCRNCCMKIYNTK